MENEPPYFVSEDLFNPKLWQIERGDELELWLPEFEDYDSEEVKVSITLTSEQKEWIEYESIFKLLIVRPNQETPLNYTGIEVILDDSIAQTKYLLRFWITE